MYHVRLNYVFEHQLLLAAHYTRVAGRDLRQRCRFPDLVTGHS
jgi:hypothetical protein